MTKGKMLISVRDHPEMCRVFDGLAIDKVGIAYTVGGSHNSKRASELVIRIW